MAITEITCELQKVDKVEAKRLHDYVSGKRQRPVTSKRVTVFAESMRLGRFYGSGRIVLAECRDDGKVYCVDGQHTLLAILQAGVVFDCLVHYYLCDTKHDYFELYGAFDTDGGIRHTATLIGVGSNSGAIDSPASKKLLTRFHSGVQLGGNPPFRYYPVMDTDRRFSKVLATFGGDFDADLEFIIDLHTHCAPENRAILIHRASVIAAIIATRRVDENQATDFWTQMVGGYSPTRQLAYPPKKLHDFLLNYVVKDGQVQVRQKASVQSNGTLQTVGKQSINRDDLLIACIRCWNAWARGDTLASVLLGGLGKVPRVCAVKEKRRWKSVSLTPA